MAKQKYITLNDLLETSAADLNENAEIMINNGTAPMKATKVKLSTILGGVKKDIANLDGDIVAAKGDIEDLQTAVQNKANSDLSNVPANIDYVVEYKNPTDSDLNWYRKWKSGKLEQGGIAPATVGNLTFLKPFANTNYTVIGNISLTYRRVGQGDGSGSVLFFPEATSFCYVTFAAQNFGDIGAQNISWRAEGQGAQ